MAKIQIKSEKTTPFRGIFHVRELFPRVVGPVIDKVLGLRGTSYGYQYSEIEGSLLSACFCGGNSVEDVTSHLLPQLSLPPLSSYRITISHFSFCQILLVARKI